MDLEQAAKTLKWLDEERRKDKQELAAMQERLKSLAGENSDLSRKVQQLQSDLTASSAVVKRFSRIDELLDGYRKEMTKQLEDAALRRAEVDREGERLRKAERDGLNKTLADLKKGADFAVKHEREAQARKEEADRVARLANDLQKKADEVNKHMDERGRAVAALEEGRRMDAKRIGELQAELADLRKRADESRGRVDVAEDLARRVESRLGELLLAEGERRAAQVQWMDAQSLAQAERDREWNGIREKAEAALKTLAENNERMNQFGETHRDMRKLADEFRQQVELMERHITEVGEMQRLGEERFRQEWAAFLADDQKRWTTHMLLRDEQWREHDRQSQKHLEQFDALAEQVAEALDRLRHMQEQDAVRLQSLMAIFRESLAEYEQKFTKAR